MPSRAKDYIYGTSLLAIVLLALADWVWKSTDPLRYLTVLLLALAASTLEIDLPRMRSTLSGGFIFVLMGIAEFSLAQTMAIAAATAVLPGIWKSTRSLVRRQVLFDVAAAMNSAAAAYWLPRSLLNDAHIDLLPLTVILAVAVYFWTHTLSVLIAVSMAEDKPLRQIWRYVSLWSYWYFPVQIGLAIAVSLSVGLQGSLFALAIIVMALSYYLVSKKLARTLMPAGSNNRRARPRYEANGAFVDVTWTDHSGRRHNVQARVIDVSELGIRIESPEPVSASTVHISAPNHEVDSFAQVCYSGLKDGKYIVGMELHVALNRRRLRNFVPDY